MLQGLKLALGPDAFWAHMLHTAAPCCEAIREFLQFFTVHHFPVRVFTVCDKENQKHKGLKSLERLKRNDALLRQRISRSSDSPSSKGHWGRDRRLVSYSSGAEAPAPISVVPEHE